MMVLVDIIHMTSYLLGEHQVSPQVTVFFTGASDMSGWLLMD
ncbi:hypothetical protein [Shewanella sp. NIFS-20-20]|nr:hypothetical protein [Shewanella sp. NIFS-20-20]